MSAELALEQSFARDQARRADSTPRASAASGRGRFDEILRRHHSMLRRVAAGILVHPDGLDDVLQESYLKAYRALPSSFANDAHEASWLYRIVYRTCLDELRRRRRRDRPSDQLADVASPTDEPLSRLALAAALQELAPADRAVLLLVDLVGVGYDTAAGILAVPRGTVASRLNTARRRFRAVLESDDG